MKARLHFYPKFHRLSILDITTLNGRRMCAVRCDCGSKRRVLLSNLRSHHTKSCACLRRDKARDQINVNRPKVSATLKHGGTSDPKLIPLYGVYRRMLARCLNPNATGYKNWGGRGIKIAKCWQGPNGFTNWLKSMGPRPIGFWLDRKNNDKNLYGCQHALGSPQSTASKSATAKEGSVMEKSFRAVYKDTQSRTYSCPVEIHDGQWKLVTNSGLAPITHTFDNEEYGIVTFDCYREEPDSRLHVSRLPGESSFGALQRAYAEQEIVEQRKQRQAARTEIQNVPVDPAKVAQARDINNQLAQNIRPRGTGIFEELVPLTKADIEAAAALKRRF